MGDQIHLSGADPVRIEIVGDGSSVDKLVDAGAEKCKEAIFGDVALKISKADFEKASGKICLNVVTDNRKTLA